MIHAFVGHQIPIAVEPSIKLGCLLYKITIKGYQWLFKYPCLAFKIYIFFSRFF